MYRPVFIPKSIYPTVKELIMITFGLLLISCGWKFFFLPNQITLGGATGISAMVQYATNSAIPMFVTYLVINLVLLIIAIRRLGWAFSVKTAFGVAVLTIAFAAIPTQKIVETELFMAVILGGLLNGAGIGIIFLNNGSSGGTDIIAKLVTQKRNITLGRVMLYCDVFIISSSYFLPEIEGLKPLEKVVYGLVAMTVSTLTVDMVVNGVRQSVQFFIFTKEFEEIADAINADIGRGVTLIDGVGWYTKEEIKILTVLVRKHESTRIFRIVKQLDPHAFVSQSSAIGVYGEGFDVIKGK